jgi:hypothetical protein
MKSVLCTSVIAVYRELRGLKIRRVTEAAPTSTECLITLLLYMNVIYNNLFSRFLSGQVASSLLHAFLYFCIQKVPASIPTLATNFKNRTAIKCQRTSQSSC